MWTPIVGRLLFAVENFLGAAAMAAEDAEAEAVAEAEAEYMVYTEAPDASLKELEEREGRSASMFVARKPLPRAAGTDPIILKTRTVAPFWDADGISASRSLTPDWK